MSLKSKINPAIVATFFVLVVSNLGHFLNYLIQLILGKYLSTQDFGIYTAVVSLGMILGSASQIIPLVISKFAAEIDKSRSELEVFERSSFKWLKKWGAVYIAVLIALTPWMADFIKISDMTPLALFILNIYIYHFLALYTGTLYGLGRYQFANSLNFFHALLRFLLTWIALSAFGFSYVAAVMVWGIANTVIWLVKMVYTRRLISQIGDSELKDGSNDVSQRLSDIMRFAIPTSLTLVGISILTNIDKVVVKHRFDDFVAGQYASAAVLAQIAFFLPQAIGPILLPELVRNKGNQKKLVAASLGLSGLISGMFAFATWLWPVNVTILFWGDSKVSSASYLPWLTVSMALAALINILANGFLAKNRFKFLFFVFGFAGCFAAYTVFSHALLDPNLIPKYLAWTMMGVFGSMLVMFFWKDPIKD
ncbi:MAG: oligosaccharide flippase family protein [Proteobacteria bacterium]|nr:oligosaccharide flippase family protein [Pseudomonadota bacterium]